LSFILRYEPCLGANSILNRNSPIIPNFKEPHPPRNPRLQGLVNSGAHTNPPPTPTSPMLPDFPKSGHQSHVSDPMISKRPGLGMSRSISDTTLRRAALHLNLSQSVLPSFTSLQQFKKELSVNRRATSRSQRKSMIVQTSPTLPRCHSPSSCVSPLGAYRICFIYLVISDLGVNEAK